eukprot:scaffold241889_cov17-Tisochrysis_lutea.AAC.1
MDGQCVLQFVHVQGVLGASAVASTHEGDGLDSQGLDQSRESSLNARFMHSFPCCMYFSHKKLSLISGMHQRCVSCKEKEFD